MKTVRQYTLPNHLLEQYEALPISRTAAMTMAIDASSKDETSLSRALARRLSTPASNDWKLTTKVSVSIDDKIYEKIGRLAVQAQLPIEHTLRLAMEDYLEKF